MAQPEASNAKCPNRRFGSGLSDLQRKERPHPRTLAEIRSGSWNCYNR